MYSSPDALCILAVDDDPFLLETIQSILEDAGHEVITANRAKAALNLLSLRPWDIVLTDRMMPEMNGEEFAREVKRRSPELPVLMITSDATGVSTHHLDSVILKPFTTAFLKLAIAACLATRVEKLAA
jgi:DNA-binding response OmpR family regulator